MNGRKEGQFVFADNFSLVDPHSCVATSPQTPLALSKPFPLSSGELWVGGAQAVAPLLYQRIRIDPPSSSSSSPLLPLPQKALSRARVPLTLLPLPAQARPGMGRMAGKTKSFSPGGAHLRARWLIKDRQARHDKRNFLPCLGRVEELIIILHIMIPQTHPPRSLSAPAAGALLLQTSSLSLSRLRGRALSLTF